MSGLKTSPFGKRLRAAQNRPENDEELRRTRPRFNPIFAINSASAPLGSCPSSSSSTGNEENLPVKRERSRSPSRSPSRDYGDRFVPARDWGDMRTAYLLMGEAPTTPTSESIPNEFDASREPANTLFTSILHTEVRPPSPRRAVSPARPASAAGPSTPTTPSHRRIFEYHTPSHPSTPTHRLDDPTDTMYSTSPISAQSRQILELPRLQLRKVCKSPYRVLDAPELSDDFYLNLVDWSSTNVLAVGLGTCVYLWTAHSAAVSKVCDLSATGDLVASVSWAQKGTTLAVGTSAGRLHIYDGATMARMRSYNAAHPERIAALAWNAHVLSSGSRDHTIHHRDVREPEMRPFRRSEAHRLEVCGLRWSGDGGVDNGKLASGANDNKVCIWDLRGGDAPLWKFHEHTAAVKALAWDPHVSGLLASGGGAQDMHIRFWNVHTGVMLDELHTGSQVCNLVWSQTTHELVSTHSFSSTTAQNRVCIWKYPSLSMVASLTGHTHRVLYLALSPDGDTIVTGAGDETLRFWNAFPKREAEDHAAKETRLDFGRLIR